MSKDMNTNSNTYTVIYTTIIVTLVAAILAFVSQGLKAKQEANEKADTISQMLTAAQFATKAELQKMGNTAVLAKYAEEIENAFTVNKDGKKVADLELDQVFSPKELKKQNYKIKDGSEAELPVFIFKNGVTVVPVYGAGLWGPVWGYIAFEPNSNAIKGAYFDHESETAGLGAKIKDDPEFRAQFAGKTVNTADEVPFHIVKGGAPAGQTNAIDAISGATMTSKGLDEAINIWLKAYANYAAAANNTTEEE